MTNPFVKLQKNDPRVVESELKIIQKLLSIGESEIVLDDEGWDSRVYIIDDGKWVFKFPRSEEIKEGYRHEIAILKTLEGVSLESIQLPVVRWQGQDHSYFGYKGVVGDQIEKKHIATNTKRLIGEKLGEFLKVLHSLELENAPVYNFVDDVAEYKEKYNLSQSVITTEFTEQEQQEIKKFFFETFPSGMKAEGEELALCHCDLTPRHVFLLESNEFGIIDFEDIAYRDKSIDFVGFFDEKAIMESMLDFYGASRKLRKKVALRAKASPVLSLPYYLGKDDQGGIQRNVARIRSLFFDSVDL